MKKVTAMIILICFITASFIRPSYAADAKKSDSGIQKLIFEYTLKENGYEAYLNKHNDKARPDKEIIIAGGDYSDLEGDSFVLSGYEGVEGNLIQTAEKGYVEWAFNIEEAGLYNIEISYYPVEGRRSSIERQLLINGEIPFNEARVITFTRMFADKTEIRQDNQGNDIRPSQIEKPRWSKFVIRDAERLFPDPLKFYFDKGVQTLRLVGIKEPMIIESIRIFNQDDLQSYQDVSASYKVDPSKEDSYMQIVQAEDTYLKSDATLFPVFDRSSSKTEPFAYDVIKLNTIGGYNWRNGGQWLSWIVSVPKDGYYKLAFKFRQNTSVGIPVTRALYIDGEQYFKEMNQVEFHYDTDWQLKTIGDDNDPYLLYLT